MAVSPRHTTSYNHPLTHMASCANASVNVKEDMKLLAFWTATNKVGVMVGLLGSVLSKDAAATRSFLSFGLTLGLMLTYFTFLGPQLHVVEALGEIPQHSSNLFDAAIAAVVAGMGVGSWFEIRHYCVCSTQHKQNYNKQK